MRAPCPFYVQAHPQQYAPARTRTRTRMLRSPQPSQFGAEDPVTNFLPKRADMPFRRAKRCRKGGRRRRAIDFAESGKSAKRVCPFSQNLWLLARGVPFRFRVPSWLQGWGSQKSATFPGGRWVRWGSLRGLPPTHSSSQEVPQIVDPSRGPLGKVENLWEPRPWSEKGTLKRTGRRTLEGRAKGFAKRGMPCSQILWLFATSPLFSTFSPTEKA
jgi:hypothetical protein